MDQFPVPGERRPLSAIVIPSVAPLSGKLTLGPNSASKVHERAPAIVPCCSMFNRFRQVNPPRSIKEHQIPIRSIACGLFLFSSNGTSGGLFSDHPVFGLYIIEAQNCP